MKNYRIAQVAQKLGISKQTLVRYEKKGILPKSPRNHINSWREYTEEDLCRMKAILHKGFTLIEMVMVLVLAGILAALAVPRFESFHAIKFDGGVKKVVSDIRYVQEMAVSRHTNCRIVFDPADDSYSAQEQLVDNGVWGGIKDPFTRANLAMKFAADPQYKGMNIVSAVFNSSNTLQFNWLGSPIAGGSVSLNYRTYNRKINVSNNTGKVTIQ